MTIGTTLSSTSAPSFSNSTAFDTHLSRLHRLREECLPNADSASVKKHLERGKLLPRDRISRLTDPGSSFLEIGQLAGLDVYDGVKSGAGLVTGIGIIHDMPCMIVANDATVKGGTYFPLTVKKHLRAQEIAFENRLPCVYLVDSGGAFLPMQDEVFPDRDHFGRIFYNQSRMSAAGIPQISVVMGSCTAGGAYVPAMSDEAIIVRNQGTIFLGGPPLVKAATGEIVTAEELGGGDVHCKISGVTDYLAESDNDALMIARRSIASFANASPPRWKRERPSPPRYDPSEIPALIPSDPKQYFPMREILARLLDDSNLDEFKSNYGTTLICGFARIDGFLVGIVANDGILFSKSAQKAAHFIQLCDQRGIALLFVQNIVGFMVGKEYEHGGIAKDGAKMVTAVACARVPRYTILVGSSFGAGNYGMCGRAYQPRFLWAWPQSKIGVMGPDQAAGVLTQVKRDSLHARGENWPEAEAREYQEKIQNQYSSQASAWYSTARLWDDGVITPEETRKTISLSIAVSPCMPEDTRTKVFGTFRM